MIVCINPLGELELWKKIRVNSWGRCGWTIVCNDMQARTNSPKRWDVIWKIDYITERPRFFGRIEMGRL